MSVSFSRLKVIAFIFVFITSLFVGGAVSAQSTVKVLSNTNHAASRIGDTVTQLLGAGHLDVDVIVHRTSLDNGGYNSSAATALNTSSTFYETANTNATNSAPYQIYTTSFTGYRGDTISKYNQFDGIDLVHNYAFTVSTDSPPPIYYTAPGGTAFGSKSGVEWTIDGTEITFSTTSPTLSELTARNSGLLASVRHDHPAWSWFDVKAALRQTASNWATGYDDTTYGFGNAFYSSSTALADNEILLQPPVAEVSTTTFGQIEFTLYPYKQTRRVKEVLFQFPSDPGFQADELSLADITTTLSGTKVMEYSDTTATSTLKPFYTSVTDDYFVWFTADNATDSVANFSRIDTYSVLGPYSQPEIHFSNTFNLTSPANNAATSSLPTLTWSEAESYLDITKYQLYVDGTLNKDNISGTSTTPSAPLSDGAHTWYVVAVNGGGATTTSLSTNSIQILSGYTTSQAWYVDNVLGDDNATGTQAAPWATISKAASVAQPGNTVTIIKNDGVPYREEVLPNAGTVQDGNIVFKSVSAEDKAEVWGSVDVSSSTVSDWSAYGGGNPDTYQRTMAAVNVLSTGPDIQSLDASVWGGSDQDVLNEGEWTYAGGVLYYRLHTGEDIDTLHIEAGQENYVLRCTARNTYRDLVVKYSNTTGASLDVGCIGEGLEIYDSGYTGVSISGSGTSDTYLGATLRHSIIAGSYTRGIHLLLPSYVRIYNNTIHDNGTGLFIQFWAHNSIIRNNVFINNTENIGLNLSVSINNFLASHNSWASGTVDSEWTNTYQGSNNLASTSPLLTDTSQRDFRPQRLSPTIDSGINIGLTTDVLGNPIYGTPDIGAVEYQPPYIMGTHNINETGTVRIYADGTYRYVNATSSANTAELTLSPTSGFPTNDYAEYMNVTINTWEPDSASAVKSWTASSSYATSTEFSISGLTANTSYDIEIDGSLSVNISGSTCDAGVCTTDNSGTLTFIYTGGWSTHTFSIEQSAIPEPAISNSSSGSGGSRSRSNDDETEEEETIAEETEDPDNRETLLNKIDELRKLIESLTAQLNAQLKNSTAYSFNKKLSVGDKDIDVLNLQKKLNSLGFTITSSGAGSPGNETTYYGPLTTHALKKFQCHYKIICYGNQYTTGYGNFGPQTRTKMNKI